MKHAHVDETLTRAEREAPFRLAPADAGTVEGPTRLACTITETDQGLEVEEKPLAAILEELATLQPQIAAE
ncbi:MAG: hypothetical protein B7Y80_01655 [Hyphomicrobium sp. 32-62-53]|nr:MAG: hypothetical protein B7Z29_02005 [Hyphomicrobium sp. 12-62-95]OYY01460.1 MAG: hypothetical protein B7Y80_01655 [Hyphomicrobium sp. 32-62-53]